MLDVRRLGRGTAIFVSRRFSRKDSDARRTAFGRSGRGELFGESEQATAAGNTGMAWRPSSREDVLSEAVAVFPEGSDEAPAREESRDAELIQAVIETLPPELDWISVRPLRSSFVVAPCCFPSQISRLEEQIWRST